MNTQSNEMPKTPLGPATTPSVTQTRPMYW